MPWTFQGKFVTRWFADRLRMRNELLAESHNILVISLSALLAICPSAGKNRARSLLLFGILLFLILLADEAETDIWNMEHDPTPNNILLDMCSFL